MRAEHRAASVAELAVKDLLYAYLTSSGSERTHELMCLCVHSGVENACDCRVCLCVCVSHMTVAIAIREVISRN